jgi:hypothetical protein
MVPNADRDQALDDQEPASRPIGQAPVFCRGSQVTTDLPRGALYA